MPPSTSNSTPANKLLASLPEPQYQRLTPYLEEVSLPVGQVLYEPGEVIQYVYFPNQAMVSLVSILEDGSTAEVGMVGNDGIVGYPVFLEGNLTTHRAIVQIEDTAMRMNAETLKTEFNRGETLQKLLLRYTQALLTQVSQTAACNRHHPLEERLARWLLTAHDYSLSDELPLTQEFISNMLGTRRASVTVAAGMLQQAGVIRYNRGKITIINRDALEATACECYSVVKREYQRLLDSRI